MTKTNNYSLKKPEPNDPLRVADFNENADKIDEAIKAVAVSVGDKGNCRIATGSYVGTGKQGPDNPTKLTFDFKPLWVMVGMSLDDKNISTATDPSTYWGSTFIYPLRCAESGTGGSLLVTWGDNWVSWHCDEDTEDDGDSQNNSKGYTHYWVALGVAE